MSIFITCVFVLSVNVFFKGWCQLINYHLLFHIVYNHNIRLKCADYKGNPPFEVWCQVRSLQTEYLVLSTEFTMYCKMLLCLHVYLPWSSATLQPLRQWSVLSLYLQRWHLSEKDLPHGLRLSCVGRVFVKLFKINFKVPFVRWYHMLFQLGSYFSCSANF